MSHRLRSILLFLTMIGSILGAQEKGPFDKIVKKDKTVVEGKILKVTDQNIEVDPKGPIPFLIIPRSEVDIILYHDNTVVKFDSPPSLPSNPPSGLGQRDSTVSYPNNDEATYWPKASVVLEFRPSWGSYLPTNGEDVNKNESLISSDTRDRANESLYSSVTRARIINIKETDESSVSQAQSAYLTSILKGTQQRVELRADISFDIKKPNYIIYYSRKFYIKNVRVTFTLRDRLNEHGQGTHTVERWERYYQGEEFQIDMGRDQLDFDFHPKDVEFLKETSKKISLEGFEYRNCRFTPWINFSPYWVKGPHNLNQDERRVFFGATVFTAAESE